MLFSVSFRLIFLLITAIILIKQFVKPCLGYYGYHPKYPGFNFFCCQLNIPKYNSILIHDFVQQ